MPDLLKMDPQRIARLRDPQRLEQVDPERILEVAAPRGDGAIVDVGAGVGFVSLPFARRFPERSVVACDVLPGMLALLGETAEEQGLSNVVTALMPEPAALPLADDSAALLIMLQVHHELDDAVSLLTECRRALCADAPIVIVDWKDEDLPGMPSAGRRVAESIIAQDLADSGFKRISGHALYPFHSVLVATTP